MSQSSVSQVLATGTQDLAALAGLFCTGSVETNAMATNLGYESVMVSALSVLGVLGIVKSTLKIVLGLERCKNAGFSLGPMRGMYGYGPDESEVAARAVPCRYVEVEFQADQVVIRKQLPRKHVAEHMPMIKLLSLRPTSDDITMYLNLGNIKKQHTLMQLALFILIPGLTAWPLAIVRSRWTWVKIWAIGGLHSCLMCSLVIPLWHAWQLYQPASHLTVEKWDAAVSGKGQVSQKLRFLQGKTLLSLLVHLHRPLTTCREYR